MIERVRQGRFGLRMWWPTTTKERGRLAEMRDVMRVKERQRAQSVIERVRQGFVFCLRE